MISLDGFDKEADEMIASTMADNTRKTYASALNLYIKHVQEAHSHSPNNPPPFPITIRSLKVFVLYMKRKGSQYSYIRTLVAGLSYYMKSEEIPDLTQDILFKKFLNGVSCKMHGKSKKYAKKPIHPNDLVLVLRLIDLSVKKESKLAFLMTVMFFGFLRISEALNLTRKDINLKQNDMMEVLIRNSKTDQEGKGQYVIIKDGGQAYSPFRYLEILNSIDPDEKFFENSAEQFNRIFRIHLTTISLDANKYNSHSFRRGGACYDSHQGVQDCMIKKHGRWESNAYIIYVNIEQEDASEEISKKL
ncbi:hypothetical protein TRFO_04238 [Tritrichomonas foetus]|uniref:Tyr recombinase domain-containing protein n=1 Tax=Tritrichomonas foetus TaxID=1144522 RepID=A0A1J4KH05_9EUKA|nr:hypothetical protein TRFO_04238 [Tritrichomonas foetus]|eukprot:OHT10240.1 hypothetical protein TRFO_04238 [Tritrichomonas foetus]